MTAHFWLGRSSGVHAWAACLWRVVWFVFHWLLRRPDQYGWNVNTPAPGICVTFPLNQPGFSHPFYWFTVSTASALQEICTNPKFIVDQADRTDICQGQLGEIPHTLQVFPSNSSKTINSLSFFRWLLASGSNCIPDPQEGLARPRHPPWPGVWPQICGHLSFPGNTGDAAGSDWL